VGGALCFSQQEVNKGKDLDVVQQIFACTCTVELGARLNPFTLEVQPESKLQTPGQCVVQYTKLLT